MSATTKRKNRVRTKVEGQKLASNLFKKGTFTSKWTEQDAKTFFGMQKTIKSVFRSGKEDETPVEWYLGEKNELLKREITV